MLALLCGGTNECINTESILIQRESDRWNVDEGSGHLTLIFVGYIKLFLLTADTTEACASSGRPITCTFELQTEYINILFIKRGSHNAPPHPEMFHTILLM